LNDALSPSEFKKVQNPLEYCEICSAILDSTRNIPIFTADERVFELPLGFSKRLHARIDEEMQRMDEQGELEPRRRCFQSPAARFRPLNLTAVPTIALTLIALDKFGAARFL
jgi:hypothetical protein